MPASLPCPFCTIPPDRVFYEGKLVRAMWDAFPVSPGHALIIPRRHINTWFQATLAEQGEMGAALTVARDAIQKRYGAEGFNIGMNVGPAAGQTVFHLHIHVIPRYRGDVADPRGGIRHVIPDRANSLLDPAGLQQHYLPAPSNHLVRGGDDPLLPHLISHLGQATRADLAVSFILDSGMRRLDEHLYDLLDRGGSLRLVTSDYLDVTEPNSLLRLLDLKEETQKGVVELRVFEAAHTAFHPKAYLFHERDGTGIAYVGSSNLSESALAHGIEWNYRVVSSRDAAGFTDVANAFEALFRHPSTRPLDLQWIDAYRRRRSTITRPPVAVAPEPVPPPPEPHEVQREALRALEETRAAGNAAGLVVLATGLGKTWLSAFDSMRAEYKRILFVAHREEILAQALHTFRRIRPEAHLGHYTGTGKAPDADVLFASIQTLGRAEHLRRFDPSAFDYIVVDEFHHAAARSYRRLLAHFTPRFLLGLTATPERSDGGDLLALCQENLVYRCDLVEGIRRGLLSPFHYFGVPDEVDYRNIPWRSTRFDEVALTQAVATQVRAQNALEQYRQRGGQRTLAFCCSQRHADFMAEFFHAAGVRSVAVHAGATSAPRALSLEQLRDGALDVIFAVDMFNEGVDLPNVDTVMMLRPTESPIVWLQQFGRGLRRTEGKDHLAVIDYIGNHRIFLVKPRTLFELGPGDAEIERTLNQLRAGNVELPPGCEVTYDLQTVEIMKGLLRLAKPDDALRLYYTDFQERVGVRPRAVEVFHDGYTPRAARRSYGSWLRLVRAMGDLSPAQQAALQQTGDFLDELEITPMSKSYKMLLLLTMLNAGRVPGHIGIADLVVGFRDLAARSAKLRADVGPGLEGSQRLRHLLESNPIAAWTGGKGTGGTAYFAYDGETFRTTFSVAPEHVETLQELVREIVEWRLAEYLERAEDGPAAEGRIICKVSHAGGRPILFLPDRARHPSIPDGWTLVMADGERYKANFVKVAVNVMRRPGSEQNELPGILRRWFGPDAGLPGTNFAVAFEPASEGYTLSPLGEAVR